MEAEGNTMQAEASSTWNVGDVILNLYKVTDILGEGGFGKVYKVRHPGWNINLAVKSPKPEIVAAAGGVENFEREAETWVNLGLHPHIVSCYYVRRTPLIPPLARGDDSSSDSQDGSPLVFAEYVAGGSLQDWIENRQLYEGGRAASLKRILDIAIQFAWGLHYAHEQGLVHQDVKPANVMLTPQGAVKVTDFGLANAKAMAARLEETDVEHHTLIVAGGGAMTPAYCSPEQANGETLTRRTDLWSWALSVLEMFQGGRSWQFGTVATLALENYLERETEDPLLPQMPESVAQLLQCCFRSNPIERPHNILDVAKELQEIYEQVTGEAYLRTEPKTGKDTADTLNNRAVSLLDLGRQDEALQLWEQAVQLQPHHPESTYNRGLILWRSGRIDSGTLVRDLEQSQQSYLKNWVTYYLLGLVHLERNDQEAALKTLEAIQGVEAQQEEVQAALTLARKRCVRTFTGHKDQVNSVGLSADSRLALSGSKDHTLKLWEVATGHCLRTFTGHIDRVNSVCFSADSRFALSGSSDYTLKLWEVSTGECIRTFYRHTPRVNSVCLSADSRFALCGCDNSSLELWEVDTGCYLRSFTAHKDPVNSVCLSPNSRFALSGSSDFTLKLWEVATGRCLRTFVGHIGQVNSVYISRNCRFVLSGSDDHTVKLWDASTGRCLRTFVGHTRSVSSVCLSTDNRFALSGSSGQTLKLWEVATGSCLHTFEGHNSCVKSGCLSADGQFALSGSHDHTIKLWTLKDIEVKHYRSPMILSQILTAETFLSISLTYERELEHARAAQKRGNYVAAAQHLRKARSQPGYSHREEAVNIWTELYAHLPRKKFLGSWEGITFAEDSRQVSSICLSRDSRFALSGSNDDTAKLWEIATGNCLRTFEGHTSSVNSVCLSADSRFALSGSSDHTLKLWEVSTGCCLRTFTGHTDWVFSVCLSADGRFALSGSYDRTVKLWEVATGRCLRILTGHTSPVYSVCLSADGRFALSGSHDRTAKLWEVATGHCLHTLVGHTDGVFSVCLSADGRFALSGSHDRTLKLWEVATGCCLRTLAEHISPVYSVCLSTDGQFALSGSHNGTTKLWELTTGLCLHTFKGYAHKGNTYEANSVCLSGDCRFVLSSSKNRTPKLWLLDWELEDRQPANWDEGAQPYLETFLEQHIPYAAPLPEDHEPTEKEITLALTRRGTPTWTEENFQNLLYTLSCVGYGWLRSEGVRQQLEAMTAMETLLVGWYKSAGEAEEYNSSGEFSNSQLSIANSQSNHLPANVTLTVTKGSLKGQEFVFNSRTTCIIGRAKDCGLRLPDAADHNIISRYHCLLDINPPDIRVRDLGSLHGTYVNGEKIGQRQPNQTPEQAAQFKFPEYDLKDGDEIKLGNTTFQVKIEVDHQTTQSSSLVNTAVCATMIAPEPAKFSKIINGLVQQAEAGDSNLISIQGYTTLRELGQGGWSTVYLVCHDQSKELMALKVMLPKVATKPWAIAMFLREVENTKALQHPNVVQLRDYGYDRGTFFFTLEYCNSGSVADLIRQRGGRLSVDEAVSITLQTLDGLEYAHNAEIPYVKRADGSIGKGWGLVHRDLKPGNIFLTQIGDSRIAKVADYGLAKAFDLAGLSGQTRSGTKAGTPRFIPRQQVINFKYAKPEVDVWAAAASLYNMLTGTYPRDFSNKDPFLTVLQTDPVPIRQRDSSIPKLLAELIDLALVDQPEIHFKTAAAFKQALESVL
jgi:WD40 repeat protein